MSRICMNKGEKEKENKRVMDMHGSIIGIPLPVGHVCYQVPGTRYSRGRYLVVLVPGTRYQ